MLHFRNSCGAIALAAFCLFAARPALADSASQSAAESFVQQNIDHAYALLGDASLPQARRNALFRTFLLSLTDTDRVARFTLGQYANSAPPAAVADFENAFADYGVAVYESRLSQFKDLKIHVTGSAVLKEDDTVVAAIASGSATPVRLGFRIRKDSNGRLILTDMDVEGIWLALWERADFTSFLQQHGGDVPELARRLRNETGRMNGPAVQ
ncbi:MAG TPA: ABC transporter substrate-binding protein [Micropepsaceae bacterium]|nr:ABC transporter substrate-binding protein [Micropepsaceae bacterium]